MRNGLNSLRSLGTWLIFGLWLGLLDGAVALYLEPSIAGGWWDRIATLLLSMALDALVFVLILGCASLPALVLQALTGVAARRWRVALASTAIVLLVGFICLEAADARSALPVSLRHGAVAWLGLSLLAGAVVFHATGRRDTPSRRSVPLRLLGFPANPLIVAFLVAALGWGPSGPRRDPWPPNVILVSLDTLRADHMGLYGYDRDTTPHLDALAERGTVFDTAIAQSHWTHPSHASFLTGLTPLALGVVGGERLDDRFVTLAERLQTRGYRTGAIVGDGVGSYIGASRGFAQGFERYDHTPYPARGCQGVLARTLCKAHWRFVRHGSGVAFPEVGHAVRWLERHRGEPFFLFLHFYDIHSDFFRLPYDAPQPYRDRFCPDYDGDFTGCAPNGNCASQMLRDYVDGKLEAPMDPDHLERMICLYDGGVAYTDAAVGRLIDAMDRLDLFRNSVIIVTADHGEAFFEHGKPVHKDLYEENLHVPLIAVVPGGVAGQRSPAVRQLLDIVPTILDLTGTKKEGFLQGHSFADILLRGEEPATSRSALAYSTRTAAIRTDQHKYIRATNPARAARDGDPLEELYDLRNDPGEQTNILSPADTTAAASHRRMLRDEEDAALVIRRAILSDDETEEVPLSERDREKLRSLGYLD